MRLIDANELKEWVENWFTVNKYYHPYSKSNSIPINELYDILEHMPTIDAEPVKHGKWIDEAEDWRNQIEWFKCSQCDFPTSTAYKYCPNCGARMDGE